MKVKHVLMIAAVLLAMLAAPAAAETVVTHSVTESYKVSIPESLTVGTAGNIGISGLIDANTQVKVSVESANEWELVNNNDNLGYSLKGENQASVIYENVLTVLAGNTGEVAVTATLNDDASPKYRGDYTDVLTFTVTQEAQDGESVLIRSYAELSQLINDGGKGLFISNVAVPEDTTLTIDSGKDITLDLNGYTLSSKYTPISSSEMFSVSGKLTVENGILTYDAANNAEFNSNYRSTIFTIQGAGTLNLSTVTAKNNGGNWMAYVVDMSNSNGLNLTAESCVLESSYIPVRVFNNNNNMHTIDIEDSTLKGKSLAFWVQYYTADKSNMDKDDIDATLSIDIFGTSNTFSVTQDKYVSPIIFGYAKYVFFDPETGSEVTSP